jgi:plastocyanin
VKLSRRQILRAGSVLVATFPLPVFSEVRDNIVEIRMQGRKDGSQVWFDPIGLRLEPGQTIRWINLDLGNSHTSTAYHPDNSGRPLRIPTSAKPWRSDYLLPTEAFTTVLTEPGVYDYFCEPHEHAGMVGRIVVGVPSEAAWTNSGEPAGAGEVLPPAAINAFPSVQEILQKGFIRRA